VNIPPVVVVVPRGGPIIKNGFEYALVKRYLEHWPWPKPPSK
jgi:hypothetical protein